MNVRDKVIVVTGGANGIGRALCKRFAAEGARAVIVADIDADAANELAEASSGDAHICDASNEADVQRLVRQTLAQHGQIDLFCANAGVVEKGGTELSNERWQRMWDINFMSHLYAARAVLPDMIRRKQGYLLHTASAAGLLTQLGSAPYAVTKHAVVAFAEWLSIMHADDGIKVSCLCPMGVRTSMLEGDEPFIKMLRVTAVDAGDVANDVIGGLEKEQFLILPHPEVATFFQHKAGDHDQWLGGMRKLYRTMTE